MKSVSKQQIILVSVLLVLLAAYVITLPIRRRLAVQVKQINAEIAAKRAAQQAANQASQVLQQAKTTAQQNPLDAASQAAYAAQLQDNGNYLLAERYWRKAVARDPSNAEMLANLGDCLTLEKREDLAIDVYRKAITLDPNNVHALTRLSVRYVALGWNQEAADLLDAALKRTPNSTPLLVATAMVDVQATRFAKAEQEFIQAYKLTPQDTAIIPLLVDAYRKGNQFAQAEALINANLATFNDPAVLYIEAAKIATAQGNPSQALTNLNAALQHQPANLEALALRGQAERALNQLPAAERDFRAVYSKDPSYNQITLMLGQILVSQGKIAEAKPLLADAAQQQKVNELAARLTLDVRNRPGDPEAHLAVAQMYLQTGQTARAVVEFKKAMQLRPGLLPAKQGLATALKQLGTAAASLSLPAATRTK